VASGERTATGTGWHQLFASHARYGFSPGCDWLRPLARSQSRGDQGCAQPAAASPASRPGTEIYLSQPGIGNINGPRLLAEFGDGPGRYASARARKDYAGSSPITRASGRSRIVLVRYVRNDRLADTLHTQALSGLTGSPGARAYYDEQTRPRARAAAPPRRRRSACHSRHRHPPRRPSCPGPSGG
jgi:Transposase IS116/IS110/IS902 family